MKEKFSYREFARMSIQVAEKKIAVYILKTEKSSSVLNTCT